MFIFSSFPRHQLTLIGCSLPLQTSKPRRVPVINQLFKHPIPQPRSLNSDTVPFRKQWKDEKKQRRAAGEDTSRSERRNFVDPRLERWELTVGIEVHAQLNTERKLFSRALNTATDSANSQVSLFDLALPGSQPEFQKATLIPALRAACAFKCDIQHTSRFDRKHYFYQDQPAGYQITQYYEPFAKDGSVLLTQGDGIAPEDGESVKIGIKQIQMEQDTAKTIQQPPPNMLLDFNRVSHPLIEIITLPQIHHPQTAAACVKKIQSILHAVGAVATGMEMGGLRADVNVSIRSKTFSTKATGSHAYHGITGLGQRTEIKNLSSFKAVEDAIVAERDRQIDVLEAGGVIEGETRGWSLGSIETRKLRGKEGEVDYRYMPDPDLPPLNISQDLVEFISSTLPIVPNQIEQQLIDCHGLSPEDARTLVTLDGGERLDYFDQVLEELESSIQDVSSSKADKQDSVELAVCNRKWAKAVTNWVLHELGGLLSAFGKPFSKNLVTATVLASIVRNVSESRITGKSAKQLLAMAFDGDGRDVDTMIEQEHLELQRLSREEYRDMAQSLINENQGVAQQIQEKNQVKKVQWFVGLMMRKGEGKVEAAKAESVLKELLGFVDKGHGQAKQTSINDN